MAYNGLHMANGGFEALSCLPVRSFAKAGPKKPKLFTGQKPCWQPFSRRKLHNVLKVIFIHPCSSISFDFALEILNRIPKVTVRYQGYHSNKLQTLKRLPHHLYPNFHT
jgi:hypothetical protein